MTEKMVERMDTPPQRLRKVAGSLLMAVVEERMTAQAAINQWPVYNAPDPSLEIAYKALWHFEADTDQQQRELYYIDAQLQLLTEMAGYLSKGEDFPVHLMLGYRHHSPAKMFIAQTFWGSVFQGFIQALQRVWLLIRRILLKK